MTIKVLLSRNFGYWPEGSKAHGTRKLVARLDDGTESGAITAEEAIGKALIAAGMVTLTYSCQGCGEPFEWPSSGRIPAQDHGWRCNPCGAKRTRLGLPRWEMNR